MKHKTHQRLAILVAATNMVCTLAQSQGAGTENSTNRASAVAASFCSVFRPDARVPNNARLSVNETNAEARIGLLNGREAIVEIDLQRNEVVCFSAFKGFLSKRYNGQSPLSGKPAVERADAMLRSLGIKTNLLKLVSADTVRISEDSTQEVVRFFWRRRAQGFCFKDDFVNVMFDSRDGELLGYRKTWGAQPRSLKVNVSLQDAKQIAARRFLAAGAGGDVRFESAELWVVTPNGYLNSYQPGGRGAERRLAWVLVVPKQAGLGSGSEIWIDAETGAFLGGQDVL